MASVRSIAERAGVSIATVSRALHNDPGISPDTRKRVLAVASSTGYLRMTPARTSTLVGFVYVGEQTLSHPFDAAVLEGLARSLGSDGYDLVILNPKRHRQSAEEYARVIVSHGVQGVILRTMSESRDVCTAISDLGFPHIVLSERFEEEQRVNYIDCDSQTASARATEYLISLGHSRIGFATHSVPDRDHVDRYQGYAEALAKHGLPLDEELVFRHPADIAGRATVLKMAMRMRNRPTAFYFADWLLAIGGLKAAHSLGVRVPQDLSIMGVDDTNLRHTVHPTLTAVCQNAFELGSKAGQSMAQILAGQAPAPLQVTLPGFFEINESTGVPPGASDQPGVGGGERPPAGHAGRDGNGNGQ
jgi:DNA-binding LacI/PurR family transcriptional regulator